MTDVREPPIVRAADRTAANEESAGHPLNPDAEIHGHALSRIAGLQRIGLWSIRLPPGKESFIYHRHLVEEEFLYVLSGRATVEIDGVAHEIGAGDFVGFPPGTAHGLRNTGTEDFLYLSGGEHREVDIADYPRHGKRVVRQGDRTDVYPLEAGAAFPGTERL
jgi:uncharacterized cupin superfamily protein